METNFYPYTFKYKNNANVLIWMGSEEKDGFKLASDGMPLIAATLDAMKDKLGDEANIVKWEEGTVLDLDEFWSAVKKLKIDKAASSSMCIIILDTWNFFEDLINTLSLENLKEVMKTLVLNKMYEKLFYGTNLEAVTPKNCSYHPLWSPEEIISFNKGVEEVWHGLSKYTNNWAEKI